MPVSYTHLDVYKRQGLAVTHLTLYTVNTRHRFDFKHTKINDNDRRERDLKKRYVGGKRQKWVD